MLRRALKMSFWICHDHLGKLVLLNLLLAAVLSLPTGLIAGAVALGEAQMLVQVALPIAFLAGGVLLPLMLVGLAALFREIIETHECPLGAFLAGIRRHGFAAVGIGLACAAALVVVGWGGWLSAMRLGAWTPWAGYLAVGAGFWTLAVIVLSTLLALPALVFRRQPAVSSLRLALLLVLANPGFTAGLGCCMAMLLALLAVPPLGLLCSIAPAGVLLGAGYELLARRYAALAALGGTPPTTADIDLGDAEDDYLNRGLRDFLFPWKG